MKRFDDLFENLHEAKNRHLKAGENLFQRGDPAVWIFFVVRGRIKLVRDTVEGNSVILHVAVSGSSFAEAALFSDRYHCTAVADIPTEVLLYPKSEVLKSLRGKPDETEGLVEIMAKQIQNLRSTLELRNIRSADERIFQYLLLQVDGKSNELNIETTYKDLAYELGLAHETLYRALGSLEKKGKIERDGRRIKIDLKYVI